MSDLVIDCYSISARLECGSQGIEGELEIEIRDFDICGNVFNDAVEKLSGILMEGRHEQIWFRCMFTGMLFRGVIRDFALDDSFRVDGSGPHDRSLRIRAIPIADGSDPMTMVSGRLGNGA